MVTPAERRRVDMTNALKSADAAIAIDDFDKAWKLLVEVMRQFDMVPGLREREHDLLAPLVRSLSRMNAESDYEPLTETLERARSWL